MTEQDLRSEEEELAGIADTTLGRPEPRDGDAGSGAVVARSSSRRTRTRTRRTPAEAAAEVAANLLPEPAEDAAPEEVVSEVAEPQVAEPEDVASEVAEPEIEPTADADEPDADEPEDVAPEDVASEVAEPETEPADADEPAAEAPEPESVVAEPEVEPVEATEPEVAEPEVAEPEVEPDVAEPENVEPESIGLTLSPEREKALWPGEQRHRWANTMLVVGALMVLVVVVAGIGGVLLLRREHQIRSQAGQLQTQLRAAESVISAGSGGTAALSARTQRDVAGLQASADRLRASTQGALWSATQWIPGLHRPMSTTRTLALITDRLANDVLPTYVTASHALTGQSIAAGLKMAPLVAQQASLDTAVPEVDSLQVQADELPRTGVRALDAAVVDVRTALNRLDGYATTLSVSAHVAPAMLGVAGDTNTLIVLQTPAEARGTGGLVGGFVEVKAHDGTVTVTRQGTNHYLKPAPSPVLTPTPDFQALYGTRAATTDWTDSNLSPDFPKVAAIWAGLFKVDSGDTVNGVAALTPELLGRILSVTGPVVVPGGPTITAANAASFLEKGLYAEFPAFDQEPARNALQLQVLQAVVSGLLHYSGDPIPLLRALGAGAGAGELRLYSADPDQQARLATMPIGGALPDASGPFFGTVVINADGTKLDAYLKRRTSYSRQAIPGQPLYQKVTGSVVLTNTAPTSGLPAYVTYRADLSAAARATATPGDHRVYVDTYLSTDAVLQQVLVDGKAVTPAMVGREEGHLFVEVVTPVLAPGAAVTVSVVAKELVSTVPPATVVQPTVLGDRP